MHFAPRAKRLNSSFCEVGLFASPFYSDRCTRFGRDCRRRSCATGKIAAQIEFGRVSAGPIANGRGFRRKCERSPRPEHAQARFRIDNL